MTTRSATIIKDVPEGRSVFAATPADGYPAGFGRELADFLSSSRMDESIVQQALDNWPLTAQATGDISVKPNRSCYDYVYTVMVNSQETRSYTITVSEWEGSTIFSGNLLEFEKWIAEEEAE